jgi:hypothetical protein
MSNDRQYEPEEWQDQKDLQYPSSHHVPQTPPDDDMNIEQPVLENRVR